MRVLPVNSETILVELDDLGQTLGLLSSLQATPVAGIRELIPAARTVMIAFDPAVLPRDALIADLAGRPLETTDQSGGEVVEIPVHYDGEDLAEVATMLGLTPADVIARHTGRPWFVAFTGFAPGFAYLAGGDPTLAVPRRTSPRTRIPAGAVALAGGFSAVYPKASPGGWQLIGQTLVPMWDLDRDPPALLQPGQRVRFVDAGPRPAAGTGDAATAPASGRGRAPVPAFGTSVPDSGPADAADRAAVVVRSPGLQALLQDAGREGQAGQGVSASGAMDRAALREANRLVGNPAAAAVIEVALGGFGLTSRGPTVVAVTGATGPLTLTAADGHQWPVPRNQPLALDDGDRLTIGDPVAGVRSYVAVRGGFDRNPVLGSLSRDTLAEVGPAPLAAGETLVVAAPADAAIVGLPGATPVPLPRAGDEVVLDIQLGPRTDWFSDTGVATLADQVWTVTPQSNRIGLRLAGDVPLERAVTTELPSEGTVHGSIQVPASGQPVVFLADHPLTGGYPVIAVIAPWHLDLAGQIPVGARIRFNIVTPFEPIEVPRP